MSRLTDKPMARAHEHLASARYAEAAGAFRAVLRIDPTEFQAHFGLADAMVARGQRAEAVDGLVTAAEACSEQDDHAAALTLYGKALSIEPGRLELHLDVAMAEAALGRIEAAQGRMENLAEIYMRSGRTDEAAEVYRCLAGWEADAEEDEEEEYEEEYEGAEHESAEAYEQPPAMAQAGVPLQVASTETVVVPTILVTPDGQLLQVPIERQQQRGGVRKVKIDDSVPPIPEELIEAAHSAPIDVADESELDEVEGTVVAYPPPPPVMSEPDVGVDRGDLEAAVVAALDNLAQLEEEDMTLVMQRLPPQPKNSSMRRRLAGESRLPEFITNSNLRKPEIPKREPAGDGKLRVRPAPRPVGAEAPAPAPAKKAAPGRAAGPGRGAAPGRAAGSAPRGAVAPAKGAAPARAAAAPARKGAPASARAAAPPAKGGPAKGGAAARGPAPARPAMGAKPIASARPGPVSKGGGSASARPGPARKGAQPARSQPPASAGSARPSKPTGRDVPPPGTTTGAKPVRPNNPLAERLRRRAGLTGPQQAVPPRSGQPRTTSSRATEPIAVRSPKFEKKK